MAILTLPQSLLTRRVGRARDASAGLEQRAGIAVLLLCLAAYGYFIPRGVHHNPDSRLALTYSLVERSALDLGPYANSTQDRALRDGVYYTDKAPGVSFALAPLYALLRLLPLPHPTVAPDAALVAVTPIHEDRFIIRYLLTFLGFGVASAAFATWLFHWLRRYCASPWPRLAVVLGYALGSPAYPLSTAAFGHVPAGICLFGVFALTRPGRGPMAALSPLYLALAGFLLGLAVTFEYPAAVPAFLVAAAVIAQAMTVSAAPAPLDGHAQMPAPLRAFAFRPARAAFICIASGAVLPLALLAAYHTAAFGAAWRTGYAFLDPSSPYAAAQRTGMLGVGLPAPAIAWQLLVGVQRGLLVHAPWLILAIPGAWLCWKSPQLKLIAGIGAGVFALLLTVNSGYAIWHGGASWGPRHLAPALPFLALLALPAAARWPCVAWVLVAVSIAPTLAVVATGTLPPETGAAPLVDFLWPALQRGHVTNSWGLLLGLLSWRALAPLLAVPLVLAVWVYGWRAAGWLAPVAWALAAAGRLDRAYLDYAEGYYLYLGSRVASGSVLYQDTAATQPPLLPLVISLLWRAAPDVYLPRLLALFCYVATAVLAGVLAARFTRRPVAGPLACLVAAALPLGASQPHVLETNALLAPLGPAVALLCLGPSRLRFAAGATAGLALAVKLTFFPLALAPLVAWLLRDGRPLRQRAASCGPYIAGLAVAGASMGCTFYVWAGPATLDAVAGELESPLLPAGAALAVITFAQVQGVALLCAAAGWWRFWRERAPAAPLMIAVAAVLLPLLAFHQGTFVSVARPAEPLVAVFAAAGIIWLAGVVRSPFPLRIAASLALAGALFIPFQNTLAGFTSRHVPPGLVLGWLEQAGPGEVIAPPYYAALAGRRLRHDYSDWTVWGMRAAAGVEPEATYARTLVADLDAGRLMAVVADFRLAYIPGVQEALDRAYASVAMDGNSPDRSVTLYVPRAAHRGTQ